MNIESFFVEQLNVWSECSQRYEALLRAQRKDVVVDGRRYILVHNPSRIVSATARIESGKVERPCFLCQTNRPSEQLAHHVVTLPHRHEYDILVNPYPILDRHFTIVCSEHTPQAIKDRMWDMAYFADLMTDYLIFFNGACSGASAPDHMHFQAVPKSLVPITSWSKEAQLEAGVTDRMPHISDSDYKNIVAWTDGERSLWCVIDRRQHRPWQYNAEGADRCLISPASLEFCGIVPLARQEDFDKMDAALLSDILGQCQRREPLIKVGVVDAGQIFFSAEERVHAMTYLDEDRILDVMDYSTNRSEKRKISEYWTHSQPFTIEGVTIGKDFHWEQNETQIFNGSLHVIARQGSLHAINLVPVEEYLKSVISSEMSASNNLELLKTHAIISRSWVLRQIENAKLKDTRHEGQDAAQVFAPTYINNVYDNADQQLFGDVASDDIVVKWWDHDQHTLYDVCADDHCQRYQGITRQVSPLVALAVEETRGEVLLDRDGNICDARFSKCCGGVTESFDTCWQDEEYHYLQPVEDPYCNTTDSDVLKLVLNDYDLKTHDFYRWTVTFTQEEISALFEKKTGLKVGLILELIPLKRGASGRIEYLKVVGSERTVVIGKELFIRKAFSESHLYSSAFDITTDIENDDRMSQRQQKTFTFSGKGWGHGVGLCQIGAACMSIKGFSHTEILSHYFASATIHKIY